VAPQVQDPAVAQPAPGSREAYVAAGLGEAGQQGAAQAPAEPQLTSDQGPPTQLVQNLSATQRTGPQQAPAQPQAPNPSPGQGHQAPARQGPVRDADDLAKAAANQQWQPPARFEVQTQGQSSPEPFRLHDQSPQNQADMKGDMTRTYHVAFSGTTQPTLSSDEQTATPSEHPPGREPHRSTAQTAKKDDKTQGR
jgi:hypothetical protein